MTPGARVPLSEADTTRLVEYLDREFGEALAAHAAKESRLDEWDRLYRAEPRAAKKNFPWDNASNVVIPLIATTVDSVLARLVNTVFGVDPFWTVRPLHKDMVPLARPTSDFMDWSRRVEFNLYRPVKTWTNEVIKYGWGWLKPTWDIETKPYFIPTASGVQRQDTVLRRPNVSHILAGDIISQVGIENELDAEWMAHRLRLTDGYLRWREAEKVYADVEDVIRNKSLVDPIGGGTTLSTDKLNTIYEVHCDFPIGRNKKLPISIIVTYHPPTRTILRCLYNPSYYGVRPFLKGTFVEYEGRQESLGICRMLRDLQDEVTTIHNQQVDNATLANTRFFVARPGIVRPGTRIHPGRVVVARDPGNDLKVMQLGDIYGSMQALESSALAFSERRSGVADYQLGRESTVMGGRATATGTLAIIQEGNRRFDLNVRDLRDTLSELGKRLLQLNQQFRPKGLAYFVQGEDGALTEQTLDLPSEYIEHRLGVELTASSATINREIEKQGLVSMVGMLTQHLQLGQQAAMVVANPQIPGAVREYTAKAFEGLTDVMRRLVGTFGEKDVEGVVPAMAWQEAMNGGLPQPGPGAPGGPGPGPAPDGGQSAPGMAGGLAVPPGAVDPRSAGMSGGQDLGGVS